VYLPNFSALCSEVLSAIEENFVRDETSTVLEEDV